MNNENTNNQVAYDGLCAFAVSTGKVDVKGGKHTLTKDGKIYVFSNPVAKILFQLLPNRVEKANRVWNAKNN